MEITLLGMRKMEEEVVEVVEVVPECGPHQVPIEFIMTEYSTHKKNKDAWYSPPFYTGPRGYKMCLRVVANGRSSGACSHVTVYVHLMRGEHDSRLVWPFRGDVTVLLVNYNNDQDHHVYWTAHFNDAALADGRVCNRVTSEERARYGWGCPKFASHTEVESHSKTGRYIDNNCLKFRITNIAV